MPIIGKKSKPVKVLDNTYYVRCGVGDSEYREETWENEAGEVVRYNLAFINALLWPKDNGRVLGYDNAHGEHHRHYCGTVEPFSFSSYENVARRFVMEVGEFSKKDKL